jgi:hypothetical protein
LGDKSSELVVEALSRASVEPDGLPLHGGKPAGLFSSSAPAKKAAQFCKSEGYLHVLRTEPRGRGVREICAITEKGLTYLFRQVSPNHVLEDLLRVLHTQQGQIGEILANVRQWQTKIDSFKSLVDRCLHQGERNGCLHLAPTTSNESHDPVGAKREAEVPSADLREAMLLHLSQWHESGDCPLPELYHLACHDRFTIGQFHDELRRLHQEEQIYLHPWTGPLTEIPEPAFALLSGHGIAYYASRRNPCP